MRIIKFRAWDTDHQKMLTGFDIFKECYCDVIMDHSKDSIKWMQFTGLKDKHGKEIWEGDIVKTVLLDDELIGMVEYADQWGTFYLGITNKHGSRIALHTVFEWLYKEESDDIVAEVIGNVYEHPDLLKGE